MTAVQTAGQSHTAAVPNMFELTYEDTKITYVPVGFGGAPQLDYEGPMGLHHFEGDEIQTFRSARGLEIRRAEMVDELPRNAAGKVLKRRLRESLGVEMAP